MSITTRTVYVGRCDECGALMSDEGYECQWPTEEDARATVEECADDMAQGAAFAAAMGDLAEVAP